MNLLDRRPDRPLPRETHERLRADLLTAIDTRPVRSPRRILVPAIAAAAVFTLVVGLAIGLRAFRPNADAPAGGPTQPTIRALSAAETEHLHQQCLAESDRITANGLKEPFHKYKVIKAFEFTGIGDPNIVTTWLVGDGIARFTAPGLPDDQADTMPMYWFCSRTKGGKISESSIRSPKSGSPKSGGRLLPMARNAGGYIAPITRVTVQPPGKPEVEAYLMGDYWFAPTEGRVGWGPYDADDPSQSKYVVRGYNAAGRVVATVPEPGGPKNVVCQAVPTVKPDGTHTFVPKTPTPPECREYVWPGRLG
ncbi:hypothetical protein [Kribbella sp. NPDC055071]